MRTLPKVPALVTLALLAACADLESPTAPPDPTTAADASPSAADLARSAQAEGFVPQRVLVRFRTGAPVDALVRGQSATVSRTMAHGTRILAVAEGRELSVAEALRRNPLVEFAEPDYFYTLDEPCGTGACTLPTDEYFGYKWDLHNDGSITDELGHDLATTGRPDADVDWLEAFDAMGPVSGSAIIGIIDTGIRASHQELTGKLVAGYDFFDMDPDPTDDNGHGTHVAGIAAGHGNDGLGVTGIAWIDQVKVESAKVCGYLYGFLYGCPSSAIADGIMWAADNGANVLNLSLGGTEASATIQSALQYARAVGALPFCAAGNEGGPVSYPAAFPECVAVSSTNWSDSLASYSNSGPEVELAAPGGDFEDPNHYSFILSSYYSSDDTYAWLAGTSMASPQAAGLAGLLHALGVVDADAKVTRMKATANDLGAPGIDNQFGAGRINVYQAVADLIGAPGNQIPSASFTVRCTELTCDFTDTSRDDRGSVVAWAWDFGDGSTSSEQSPTHTYSAEGTYTVTLTATDDEGADGSFGISLTVPTPNVPPTASFTSSCSALTCDFTDTSTDEDGVLAAWSWDFGDGATSAEQNPSHTYAAIGTYTVTLVAADDDGDADTVSATVNVQGPNDPPVASFTSSCDGLVCDFTDTSTDDDGSIVTRGWSFGDGWGANGQNPSHTYGTPGTYLVTLTVYDDDGAADTTSTSVTLFEAGEEPTASFTTSCTDLTCAFTDMSSDAQGAVVAWSWDFGDGSTSTEQSPGHTYAVGGTYTVTLTATDDVGATGSFSRDVTVPSDNQPPTASFTASCSGLDCAFTDASADGDGSVVTWSWDFGDGNASAEQSPSHAYQAGGTYTVTLTATDDDGAADTFSASVTVVAPNQPPTASFTSSCTDLTCYFVDTSTDPDGSIVTRGWNFGDGWGSNGQNPVYTYGASGTYTVTLWVFDDDAAADTVSASVTVYAPGEAPTASFTASCTDLTCDFTDTSTDTQGSVVSWSWDFGDGGTSSTQSPSHTFPASGTYDVALTVTNDRGASDTFTKSLTVPLQNQPPTASFTTSCPGLTCDFTDTSTDGDGAVVAWSWDFGDGATSSAQSPSHDYAAEGTYTVTLVATDDDGASDTASATVTAAPPNQPPTASFTWSCVDLACSFSDTSTDPDGSIVTRGWSFGDGWGANGQYPSHTYGAPGVYTVSLTVYDDDGASDVLSMDITVVGAPTASFTSSCNGLTCDFTDTSTDDGAVVFWSWDFGDGGTSFAQNPSHSYTAAGTYTVTLMVSDDGGATDTYSAAVTVTAQNQAPSASFTSACTDLDCAFSDTSTDGDGTVVAWAWDFGDGGTSGARDPSHTYAAAGTYTVTLVVTDDDGATDSASATVAVSAPPVVISLSAVGYKVRGLQKADLTWSGATSASVDVYRNGTLVATWANDGFETDAIDGRGSGTYTYRLCEAGTSTCSGTVTVTF